MQAQLCAERQQVAAERAAAALVQQGLADLEAMVAAQNAQREEAARMVRAPSSPLLQSRWPGVACTARNSLLHPAPAKLLLMSFPQNRWLRRRRLRRRMKMRRRMRTSRNSRRRRGSCGCAVERAFRAEGEAESARADAAGWKELFQRNARLAAEQAEASADAAAAAEAREAMRAHEAEVSRLHGEVDSLTMQLEGACTLRTQSADASASEVRCSKLSAHLTAGFLAHHTSARACQPRKQSWRSERAGVVASKHGLGQKHACLQIG